MKSLSSIFFIFSMFSLCVCSAFGQQGIGTGDTPPDANAILELRSTTKGLLLPRLTIAQINAISNPVAGMVVYNTDDHCLCYYANGKFNNVIREFPAPPPASGSSVLVGFYNGYPDDVSDTKTSFSSGEAFSENTYCVDKPISVTKCGSDSTVIGASGYAYRLTEINGQCWIAENLREVPSAFSPSPAWVNNRDKGSWGYYNSAYAASSWGSDDSKSMLYQWRAAMNGSTTERSQGVCPTGFHIPSNCEWMYLEHGLGMPVAEQIGMTDTDRGKSSRVAYKLGNDGWGSGPWRQDSVFLDGFGKVPLGDWYRSPYFFYNDGRRMSNGDFADHDLQSCPGGFNCTENQYRMFHTSSTYVSDEHKHHIVKINRIWSEISAMNKTLEPEAWKYMRITRDYVEDYSTMTDAVSPAIFTRCIKD